MEKQEAAAAAHVSKTGFTTYEASDRIATITLDRPQAANAQTLEMLDDLDDRCWARMQERLGPRRAIETASYALLDFFVCRLEASMARATAAVADLGTVELLRDALGLCASPDATGP